MTEMSNLIATRTPRPLRIASLLLLLVLAGALGWRGLQLLSADHEKISLQERDLNALEVQNSKLENRLAELTDAARRNAGQMSALESRFEEQGQVVARLTEQYQGGRTRMQMTVVEHLLMTANERALLQHDVDGAITALELADQRLAVLAEPRLFTVRRTISEEIAALRQVPRIDLTAAALTFSSLINRVPRLPLRAQVPSHFEIKAAVAAAVPATAAWPERLWASVKQALGSLFSVHRNVGPAPRLLPPDAEALVVQSLSLKLEGARLALLSGDAVSYRDLCAASAAWIKDYFRADDPGVLAAQAELERLTPLKLNSAIPDITRSLTLLRAQMEGPAR
jgi:uncharacterized protein HemX